MDAIAREGKGWKSLEGVSYFDIEANDIAVKHAAEAATKCMLPDTATVQYVYYFELVQKIQKTMCLQLDGST